MSLLLDALKRAEEAKRAKQPVEIDAAPDSGPTRANSAHNMNEVREAAELSLQDVEEVVVPGPALRRPQAPASPNETAGGKFNAGNLSNGLELEAASLTREATPSKAARVDDAQQRETAQKVFAAKQAGPQDGGAKRGRWLAPVIAVILAIVGGAGWYVWNEVNKISRPVVPIASRPSGAPGTPAAIPPAAQKTGQLVTEAAKTEPRLAEVASMPPLLPPPAKDQPLPKSSAAAVSGVALTERQALAKSLKDAPVAKEPPLALSRTSANDTPVVSPALLKAYAALRAGDFRQAKALYAQALTATPNNLDAHLGMATAAARLGETALAIRHYRDTLDIDPRNGTAIAGLLTLTGEGGGPTEVELKTLISRNPDAASLQFALGNLYSGERRWVEAQQAYFEAFRLDPEAPDYVYNLAVSLDQLRQASLARQYYQRALAMTGKSAGQFDKEAVIRRIQDLARDSPDQGQARNGTTAGNN